MILLWLGIWFVGFPFCVTGIAMVGDYATGGTGFRWPALAYVLALVSFFVLTPIGLICLIAYGLGR